jgi:hypothetical protein
MTLENKEMPGRGELRRKAGRKAVWQDRETQRIRVPVAIKEQLLDIGTELDWGHSNVVYNFNN